MLLTPTATAQRGSLLESRAPFHSPWLVALQSLCLVLSYSSWFSHSSHPLFMNIKGDSCSRFRVSSPKAIETHFAEVSLSKMLNHCQLLAFSGGEQMKTTNSLHASIPPAGSTFDGTVPLNWRAATCLDQPTSLAFLSSLCTCCWCWAEPAWHLLASPASPFIKSQWRGRRKPLGTALRARKAAAQSRGWLHWHQTRVKSSRALHSAFPPACCASFWTFCAHTHSVVAG